MLLLPEGQGGKAWEFPPPHPPIKKLSFGSRGGLERKVLALSLFKGLSTHFRYLTFRHVM
jgi:hypothetical protein